MFPGGTTLRQPIIDDDKSGERVGPPPAKRGIQANANQHSTGQCGINQSDAGFRGKYQIFKLPACVQLPLR